jgi:S-formylglutathione hydrolase FrmB
MYTKVTAAFADRIHTIFASEESLQAAWREQFAALEFDRTNRWNTILRAELKKAWAEHGPVVKASITLFDENRILGELAGYLDFNLFT